MNTTFVMRRSEDANGGLIGAEVHTDGRMHDALRISRKSLDLTAAVQSERQQHGLWGGGAGGWEDLGGGA